MLLVVAVVGAYLFVSRDDTGADATRSVKATPTTTAVSTPDLDVVIGSSTVPKTLPWTPTTDAASQMRWTMPGTDVTSLRNSIGTAAGGPIGVEPTLWMSDDGGPHAAVTIWAPAAHADQGSIDDIVAFHRDRYRRAMTPYPKALTVAGRPAAVFDGSTDQTSTLEAIAVIDGSLALIEVNAFKGEKVDPKVFEQLVASFAQL